MRSNQPRVLPFPTPRDSASWPPKRPPSGVVATMSIDATEVARLVARELADEWVAALIEEHRREAGTAQGRESVRCGAPRRHPPHGPCRSTGLLANGRCRWHQGPERAST